MTQVDQKFLEAVRSVVEYLWDDERKHFETSGATGDHIFTALEVLEDGLETLERSQEQRSEESQGV